MPSIIIKQQKASSPKSKAAATQKASSSSDTISDQTSRTYLSASSEEFWDDDDRSYGDDMSEDEEEEVKEVVKPTTTKRRTTTRISSSKTVRFHESITLRHYNRILGDNPSCLKGPPLSIDWNYQEEVTKFQSFEVTREPQRRSEPYLRLHSTRKRQMLLDQGVSEADMKQTMAAVQKTQKQRQQSAKEARFLNHTANNTTLTTQAEIQDAIRSASKAQQKRSNSFKLMKRPKLFSAVQRVKSAVLVSA